MWNITTPTGHNVPFEEIDSYRSRAQVLERLRPLLESQGHGSLLPTIERDFASQDPLPGVDGIETWGPAAVAFFNIPEVDETVSSLQFGRIGETARGEVVNALTWVSFFERESIAFHSPEVIVADVSGLDEIEITGPVLSGETDPNLPPARSFLEWREYIGSGTLVAEGETEFETSPGATESKARIPLLKKPAGLIGRVVHCLAKPVQPKRDPFFFARQRYYEKRFPELSLKYATLNHAANIAFHFANDFLYGKRSGSAVIFVHGTFSCALPNLTLLDPLGLPTFRFEHDTFLSVLDNVDELVGYVETLAKEKVILKSSLLHLVGHSRGGLVARHAGRELTERGYKVAVRTYGTPHVGTPLANLGSALLSTGRSVVGSVFSWDPCSLAGKLLLKGMLWSGNLPEGLDVMRPESEVLRLLRKGKDGFDLRCYGGEYDLRTVEDGVCAGVLGEIVYEGYGKEPNDLVVPTASALGAGVAQPRIPNCDHFHYFSNDELKKELQTLPSS